MESDGCVLLLISWLDGWEEWQEKVALVAAAPSLDHLWRTFYLGHRTNQPPAGWVELHNRRASVYSSYTVCVCVCVLGAGCD